MTQSLSGRVAVVTGAARGIGDAIAARLLADGARIFSLDKIAPPEARAGVTYLETDVTELKGTDKAPSCRLTVLFWLLTPVAVPTTVNGTAIGDVPVGPPVTVTV